MRSNLQINDVEFPSGNRLIYDWISMTTRIHKPDQIMDLIGMRDVPWEILTSGNGYNWRHYFGGISISFCEKDMTAVNGFYLLEMSGQGCRTFETYGNGNYNALFSLVRKEQGKEKTLQDVRLTRLDVAYDDLSGKLDIDQICDKTRRGEFVSRIQRYEAIYGSKGNSVNFGSKGSNVFIRIYDKAMERGFTDGRHWIRCELQLRKENACGFTYKLEDHSISELYTGVLKNYLSFREPNDSDSNKRRWEESPWWSAFLDNAKAISVAEKPGVLYNLSVCEHYVLTYPLGSIKTLIEVHGADAFLQMINECPMPKNPKYKRLIAMAGLESKKMDERAGRKSITFESDQELIDYAEYAEAMRAEYAAIKRDSDQKHKEYRQKEFLKAFHNSVNVKR